MTRVEKVAMTILILAIIATVVFWKDVRSAVSNNGNKENVVENEMKKKNKDSDDGDKKKKKNKDNDNESFLLSPRSDFSATLITTKRS
ncbi:MAG TPA: hypothetical protein VNT20_08365 [Flavisolibacter sp.]|nr:hypothetical protein [Flavisolibacter sp.]